MLLQLKPTDLFISDRPTNQPIDIYLPRNAPLLFNSSQICSIASFNVFTFCYRFLIPQGYLVFKELGHLYHLTDIKLNPWSSQDLQDAVILIKLHEMSLYRLDLPE